MGNSCGIKPQPTQQHSEMALRYAGSGRYQAMRRNQLRACISLTPVCGTKEKHPVAISLVSTNALSQRLRKPHRVSNLQLALKDGVGTLHNRWPPAGL